jgi:DNA-directed RNA polymerase subunit RPC12/RpoP
MLLAAVDKFIVATRDFNEAKKAQYTDMTGEDGAKTYFRASELGYSDRKIIYGFFKHQLPTVSRSAKSIRQLTNGDSVHDRYQKLWNDMGALISMEQRVSSKEDEYLKQFPWEWAGHYDAELDINILRAYVLGKCTVNIVKHEGSEEPEVEVDVDDAYAKEYKLFDEDYEPLTLIADIKTMNPWGFKRLAQGNLGEIQGYIDQISYYMYMKNTPYGSIFVEDKGSNDVVEVQVLWKDLHEDVTYEFDPMVHGEQGPGIFRVTIDNERFFGSEKVLGLVPRINKLNDIKEAIKKADTEGNMAVISELMPPRCSEDPSKFPCSWGDGKEKCEYFEHCWNQHHHGLAVRPYEVCPKECIWEHEVIHPVTGEIKTIKLDSRKVPVGITQDMLNALYKMGAVDMTKFVIDEEPEDIPAKEAEESALNADSVLTTSGELKLTVDKAPAASSEDNSNKENTPQNTGASEAIEYKTEDGQRAIHCANCKKEITFQKLGAGNTKKCPFCNHTNRVIK